MVIEVDLHRDPKVPTPISPNFGVCELPDKEYRLRLKRILIHTSIFVVVTTITVFSGYILEHKRENSE